MQAVGVGSSVARRMCETLRAEWFCTAQDRSAMYVDSPRNIPYTLVLF